MIARLLRILAVIGLVLGGLWLGFTIAMRTKFQPVQQAIRRTNRAFFNPMQMKSAGRPGAYASVVRHVGRSSGTSYQTPVVVIATDDCFVIALPYGPKADWVRNVLAAGSAELLHEGVEYRTGEPEVVATAAVIEYVPPNQHRSLRLYGVDEFLRLRRVGAEATSAEPRRVR